METEKCTTHDVEMVDGKCSQCTTDTPTEVE
ncbi:hypothetical protein MNBD_BACTEROID04-1014 [hydrothermal vent metagenome]|uniref:Uncharacterized protein n=1 Tax=hydrothermal vent metagenome TaxID=652676 RepID=A0A3B0UIN7_9ZZZZ